MKLRVTWSNWQLGLRGRRDVVIDRGLDYLSWTEDNTKWPKIEHTVSREAVQRRDVQNRQRSRKWYGLDGAVKEYTCDA